MEKISPRVLLVIYGREPVGWASEARRAVSMLNKPIVRVLAVLDFTRPPFTSLTPFAHRAYSEAIAYWREQQEVNVQGMIDQIVPFLPEPIEIVRLQRNKERVGDVIAEHVINWPADAVVVATPALSVLSRLGFGFVSDDLLRETTCAVIVTRGATVAKE
jgi:nucleotide-binding universal stress UspA family protein